MLSAGTDILESASAHARSGQPEQQSKKPIKMGYCHLIAFFWGQNTQRNVQNG